MRKIKKKNIFSKLFKKRKEKIENNKDNKNKSKNNKYQKNNPNKNKKQNTKYKNNNNKVKKRSLWKKLVTFVLILGIIGVFIVTTFLGYIVITAPKFSESAFNVKDQTVVYDINGAIIAKLGVERRESVTYDELPQVLIDAIIATEDSRYFQHNGVDLPRFIKATVLNLVGQDDAGGASTITMQTVKNNLTQKGVTESNKIKKIIRKFQDVYLAVFKVEKEYSKEEIIELYVNNYNLGSNVYGVGEAAKYYFGKHVSELTLPEAALIAGLFQAPNGHNPYKNIESATTRRKTVLYLMRQHGYITKEEEKYANSIPIEAQLTGVKEDTEYQGYIDTVVEEIITKTGDNPYSVPMKIYTTMEKSIQNGINKVLASTDKKIWRDDKVQGAVAVVNVETGAIAAVGTGRNRDGIRQFNLATQAKRQPGSTAKPIFDYGPGIEYNNMSSYTLFVDEPWGYSNGVKIHNWDNSYKNLITMRTALGISRNIPALKAFQQVGPKNSQKFAYSLGFDVSLNQSSENYHIVNKTTGVDNTINEAYSIGGVAEGFTPLQMAVAYAAFANGGYYTEAYSVTKIEYRDTGEIIEYKPTKNRVMKDSTAYIINKMLELAPFRGGAPDPGSHVAVKTGTSNYDEATMKKYHLPDGAVNDLWTIGYTSKYSVAVWYGYNEVSSTTYNLDGDKKKDKFTEAVWNYIPKESKSWSMPSSVVSTKVEMETWPAKLPSEYTPSDMITTEYFVRGSQPSEVSERYAKLNDIENVTTTKNGNSVTIRWDYTTPKVYTESYLKEYFNNSVWGNSKQKYYDSRLAYNNNTLGKIGFGIYLEESDGTLTLVGFTKENEYTYKGYGDTTLVIKAEHEKFKSNASNGTNIKLSLENITNEKLLTELQGNTNISTKVATYEENGIKVVYYGELDVTSSAEIKYTITVNNEIKEFSDKKQLQDYVNTLSAGNYKIIYIIKYLNKEKTLTRNITLR